MFSRMNVLRFCRAGLALQLSPRDYKADVHQRWKELGFNSYNKKNWTQMRKLNVVIRPNKQATHLPKLGNAQKIIRKIMTGYEVHPDDVLYLARKFGIKFKDIRWLNESSARTSST